jgi:hypothetical protein
MLRNSIINLVLKVGLGISLLFATLASFVTPSVVVSKWPNFIAERISEQNLAEFTGLVCLGLTVWLLSGKTKFASSVTVGILVLLTILSNLTYVTFVFSIFPLFFISIALSLRYYPRIRVVVQTKVTPLGQTTEVTLPSDNQAADLTDLGVTESDIHLEHDQHLFISKQ